MLVVVFLFVWKMSRYLLQVLRHLVEVKKWNGQGFGVKSEICQFLSRGGGRGILLLRDLVQ